MLFSYTTSFTSGLRPTALMTKPAIQDCVEKVLSIASTAIQFQVVTRKLAKYFRAHRRRGGYGHTQHGEPRQEIEHHLKMPPAIVSFRCPFALSVTPVKFNWPDSRKHAIFQSISSRLVLL